MGHFFLGANQKFGLSSIIARDEQEIQEQILIAANCEWRNGVMNSQQIDGRILVCQPMDQFLNNFYYNILLRCY
jgi:hypothetical protein